jgi:hypothetical protein
LLNVSLAWLNEAALAVSMKLPDINNEAIDKIATNFFFVCIGNRFFTRVLGICTRIFGLLASDLRFYRPLPETLVSGIKFLGCWFWNNRLIIPVCLMVSHQASRDNQKDAMNTTG